MQTNAACAGATQAIALAYDMIQVRPYLALYLALYLAPYLIPLIYDLIQVRPYLAPYVGPI